MKSSLNSTVVLSVLFTVAVTLLAGAYFIIQEEQGRILRNMKEETSTLSSIIADNLSQSFQRVTEERELLQSLAEQIHRFEKLVWVEIFNRDGIIVAHTNRDRIGGLPNATHLEYVKRVVKTGDEIEEEEEGRGRFVRFVPVYVSEGEQREIAGVMELAIEMQPGMKEARDRSDVLAELYKNIAGNVLSELANNQDYIQLVTERVAEGEKVMWIEIFDRNATIIAHTEKGRLGQRPLPIHEQYVKNVLQTGVAIEEEDFKKNRFNRFVPYFIGSNKEDKEVAGVVELVMDMRPVISQLNALKNRMIITALALMIVIVSILLFMLRKLVLRPVGKLIRATREMAEGDMDREVNIASKNELGELGDAFNSMAVNLKRAHADLMDKQDRLLEAKGKAEKASIAKSEFLASMSHEIRTPMNMIIGMADVLKDASLTAEEEKCLNRLARAGDHLLRLINNILDLSKIEANKLEMHEVGLNIERLLGEVDSFIGVLAREKGLKLSCRIAPDVPSKVLGDPHCLMQILYNLVSNAIKFTEKGGIDVNVRTTGIKDNTVELEFYVRDTGIGIPEDKLGIIFERFTQADSSTTRNYGGTGLGTTISKMLAENMGGRMWVESREGEGSTFYFTVKLKMAEKEEAKKTMKEKPAEKKELPAERPLRMLIVEDSEDNIMLMQMYLKNTPHTIEIAENGKIAVEKFQSADYDLVIMDVEMPVMDGYTATKEIRKWEAKEKKRPTPIVALTAHALKEHEQKSIDAGCTAHITKPIKRQMFIKVINEYASSSAET